MRKTKYCYADFTFYDRTGIQEYLEKMAAKGWMLDKMLLYAWRFRRIQPKAIRFAVTYTPEASEFDSGPSERQKTFKDFCEYAGWKLAAGRAQMQIFYTEETDSIPIETDALVEVRTIHQAVKKEYLKGYIMILVLGIFLMSMMIYRFFHDTVSFFTEMSGLILSLCCIGLITSGLIEILGYAGWYRKARKEAENFGKFTSTRGYRKIQRVIVGAILAGYVSWILSFAGTKERYIIFLSFAYIVSLTLIVNMVKLFLKRKQADARTNKMVILVLSVVLAIVFSGVLTRWSMEAMDNLSENVDTLPIAVEDIKPVDYAGYFRTWHQTGTKEEWSSYQEEEAGIWEADAVYQRYLGDRAMNDYLICYDDHMVEFSPSWEMSEEEKNTAGKLLRDI